MSASPPPHRPSSPVDLDSSPPPSPPGASEATGFMTPPDSPRADYYGSITSPISPAVSIDSPKNNTGDAATKSDTNNVDDNDSMPPKKPRKKAFLFRLLGNKKKKEKAEKAGLAPPALAPKGRASPSPEPQIDWLENKAQTQPKKSGGGLFASFRNKNNNHVNANGEPKVIHPPKASWIKKKQEKQQQDKQVEPLSPKKEQSVSRKKGPSPPPSPKPHHRHREGIDNIVVEETYVTEDDAAAEGTTKKITPAAAAAQDPRRKAIIQDSWDFYRLICSLVCDRDRYHETFRTLQKDPVYPYLNSLTSVNDPFHVGYENFDKAVIQQDAQDYKSMTKLQVAQALENAAHETLPDFVEVCKGLAGSLGVEELGIGPIKEAAVALRKAQRKYDGDLLKVTDFCRALIIVDDFAALLGLLELVRDSYGDLIRRVKLSTLKANQPSKVGGYRDCIINMEINGHICELQVHLKPLWNICRTKGYKHYVHSLEYKTDSFKDAYASLQGLDRKTLRELIALADDLTQPHPLDNVAPNQEKIIMDYFALAGLYYKVASYTFGEIFFSRLMEMRKETFGSLHPQTEFLNRYYVSCLRKQNKNKEANLQESTFALDKANAQKAEKDEMQKEVESANKKAEEHMANEGAVAEDEVPAVGASASFWDTLSDSITQGTNSAYDLIMDPNRKVREEEQATKAKIRSSKQVWRAIRRERYPFLEGVLDEQEGDSEMQDEPEETQQNVEDAAQPAVASKDEQPAAEEAPKDEKPKEEPLETEPAEKKGLAPEKEADNEAAVLTATAAVVEHVEEKKEDGEVEPTTGDDKDAGAANEKAIVVEDESPSALEKLMDSACSLCAPRSTSSS